MINKLLHTVKNLIPLSRTILRGGLCIATAMFLSSLLITMFHPQTYEGYLMYLSARDVPGLSLVVAMESLASAFFIHYYIVKYESQ